MNEEEFEKAEDIDVNDKIFVNFMKEQQNFFSLSGSREKMSLNISMSIILPYEKFFVAGEMKPITFRQK